LLEDSLKCVEAYLDLDSTDSLFDGVVEVGRTTRGRIVVVGFVGFGFVFVFVFVFGRGRGKHTGGMQMTDGECAVVVNVRGAPNLRGFGVGRVSL